jgi:hypothetical protein
MSATALAAIEDDAPSVLPLHVFQVSAAADPGMLPRILHEYAKRDLVPVRVWSRFATADRIEVEIVMEGGDDDLAALIANKLRVIPFVLEVQRR